METPKILHPAIRQYRHNIGDGLVMGFDCDITTKIVAKQQQEIENLRSDAKETDIALMACGDSYRDMKADRDEWKRRAKTLWAYMPNSCFIALVRAWPEAANWFEEDKDDGTN